MYPSSNTLSTPTAFVNYLSRPPRAVVSGSDQPHPTPSFYSSSKPVSTSTLDINSIWNCKDEGKCLDDPCFEGAENACAEGLGCHSGHCKQLCKSTNDCWIGDCWLGICMLIAPTSESLAESPSSDSTMITSASSQVYVSSTRLSSTSATWDTVYPSASNSTEISSPVPSHSTKSVSHKIVYVSIPVVVILLAMIGFLVHRRRRRKTALAPSTLPVIQMISTGPVRGTGLSGLGENTGAWIRGYREYRSSTTRNPQISEVPERTIESKRVSDWLGE